MAHNNNNRVKLLEVCRVTPSMNSPEFSFPLTFFDTFWLKFHPVVRIFFYQLTHPIPSIHHFNSLILPKLKHSLSITLTHFLPLAGTLTWPPQASQPIIFYTPNDGVSLTVAESNNPDSFNLISGNDPVEATQSRSCVPELNIMETEAAVIALQVTFFPNQGFSIGVSSLHAVLDGKSSTMFVKAWAHINKHLLINNSTDASPLPLPLELTPVLDRTVIKDPEGLSLEYIKEWLELKWPGLDNSKSLKLLPALSEADLLTMVRATFQLSREDIGKLKEKVLSQLSHGEGALKVRFSTFVLTFAYTLVCMVKAKEIDGSNEKFVFGFTADCRARLDPPIPENYFGNCVTSYGVLVEAEALRGKYGIVMAMEKISEMIKGLEKEGVMEGAKGKLGALMKLGAEAKQWIGVAGSTRFEVYRSDFGWGKPKKVEVTSIDGTGAISMADSRDGSGGVEIGLVLKKHEMDVFGSLFLDGLKEP